MTKVKEDQLLRSICMVRRLISKIEFLVSFNYIYRDRDLSYIFDQEDYESICCDLSDTLRGIGMYYDKNTYERDDIFEW